MRTNEERMELIFLRTEEIQKEQRRKRRQWLEAGCVAACLILVISLGIALPELMNRAVSGTVTHNSGAASLIASQSQLGYIMVGIASFVLGCVTTILLYRIREWQKNHREEHEEMQK